MRTFLKWAGIILLVIVAVVTVLFFINNESQPQGQTGPEADALALEMEAAVGKTAWDSTRLVHWRFAGMHSFLWDKDQQMVEVRWDDNRVLLRTNEQTGIAYQGIERLNGDAAHKLIAKAWSFFCNDSFWLAAPFKSFDPGVSRAIVDLEDGSQGLLVSYSSGGVTPGDAYLFILDDDKKPEAWKLWVKIIPLGGVVFSWEEYVKTPQGAQLSSLHKGLLDIRIDELATGNSFAELGKEDPFVELR